MCYLQHLVVVLLSSINEAQKEAVIRGMLPSKLHCYCIIISTIGEAQGEGGKGSGRIGEREKRRPGSQGSRNPDSAVGVKEVRVQGLCGWGSGFTST